MKGISKVLSASIVLMKLKGVYSTTVLCGDSTQGLQGTTQPSYVLVPSAPETIANCGYSPQNMYVPSTPTTMPSTVPGTTGESETPTSPTSSPTEDVGTCKIAVVKHCDAPGTSSTPCEPEQTLAPSQPVAATIATPLVVASVQTPQAAVTILTPKAVSAQPATIISPFNQAPGYYNSAIPGQILTGNVLSPSASSCQVVPGTTGSSTPQQLPGAVSSGTIPCQIVQGTQSSGNTPGQQFLPGIVPVGSLQPDQATSGTPTPSVSQSQSGQQCCCTPPITNPVMPTPMGISSNGYPSSTAYAPTLGQLGPCIDTQKSTSSCEPKEKPVAQYGMEACAAPTPTAVLGNAEYLLSPGMYNSLNSPCNACCQQQC
ncbi:polar tube protein Ptp1 [Encephalitozoon intestinalis ATCC 50506]|uniref:Polar tube protein 1 n=2 Tax=Encephalitozoon intestinalis TaxID=58839 RepID=PTP1_ENCIN|nr:polar tube protein Ptp1 [Encephalitozoon intestinalis ATCC 50506]Q5F2J0.1 RecName: Full=Polar tube protein 1; AltName: Full=Major polar tube protein; Short=Major PTP; Flags: Precursor [Encephalitozoon intestinalis]ADM11624.1 polar tube protein Ptp1 [Encephalitozoon intestinalis ATCC 50506]UTX45355.1 hypothetical protein GPK93_06g09060 [Encephalitozoon intestinalis]CAI54279.1 polar tube protein 1 [Encephalitozoon intestinalis]